MLFQKMNQMFIKRNKNAMYRIKSGPMTARYDGIDIASIKL